MKDDINKIADMIHNFNIFDQMKDILEDDGNVAELDSLYRQWKGNDKSDLLYGLLECHRPKDYDKGGFYITRLLSEIDPAEAIMVQLHLISESCFIYDTVQESEDFCMGPKAVGKECFNYIKAWMNDDNRYYGRNAYMSRCSIADSEEFIKYVVQDYVISKIRNETAKVWLLDYIKGYCQERGFDQEGLERACRHFCYPEKGMFGENWCFEGCYPEELKKWAEVNLPKTGGRQRRYIAKKFNEEKYITEIVSSGVSLAETLGNSDKRLIQEIPFDLLKKIVEKSPEIINIPNTKGEKLGDLLQLEEIVDGKKRELLLDNNVDITPETEREKAAKVEKKLVKTEQELAQTRADLDRTEQELAQKQANLDRTEQELAQKQIKLDKTMQKLEVTKQQQKNKEQIEKTFLEGVGISDMSTDERQALFERSNDLRQTRPVMQDVSLTTMCRVYVAEEDTKAKLEFLKELYQIRKGGKTNKDKNEMADTFARVLDKTPELKADDNLVRLSKRDTVVKQPTRVVKKQVEKN